MTQYDPPAEGVTTPPETSHSDEFGHLGDCLAEYPLGCHGVACKCPCHDPGAVAMDHHAAGVSRRVKPSFIAALRRTNEDAKKRGWRAEIGVDDLDDLLDWIEARTGGGA